MEFLKIIYMVYLKRFYYSEPFLSNVCFQAQKCSQTTLHTSVRSEFVGLGMCQVGYKRFEILCTLTLKISVYYTCIGHHLSRMPNFQKISYV